MVAHALQREKMYHRILLEYIVQGVIINRTGVAMIMYLEMEVKSGGLRLKIKIHEANFPQRPPITASVKLSHRKHACQVSQAIRVVYSLATT